MRIDRRTILIGATCGAITACVPLDTSPAGRLEAKLRILEASLGGTLGVAIHNTGTGQSLEYRPDALFPHCSSFKLSLAALVLKMDQDGELDAGEQLRWVQTDLMPVSPFTTERLDSGASLRELAEAAQEASDNAAANLLLARIGGPERLTQFWRVIGDEVSRLDRNEPDLNHVPAGEVRDTTSPRAMAATVGKILFGDILSAENRATLRQWMADTKTGARRVRAGLPQGWASGDKTGTSVWPGMGSVYVDIGFAVPPLGPPLTFAAYYRSRDPQQGMDPASEDVLREVGGIIGQFAARSAA